MTNLTTGAGDEFQSPFDKTGVIVTTELMSIIEDANTVVVSAVSVTGTVLNALNIRAFRLIGKEDGVNVSLLSLSLSDFGLCLFGLAQMMTNIFRRMESRYDILFPMDPWVPTMFVFNIGNIFLATTTFTTTFLAVARCMCVARPFQFKDTFTRSRSILIHVCFFVICIGGFLPLLTQMGAQKAYDAKHNTTRFVMWLSDKRDHFKDIAYLIFDTVLTVVAQFTLIICLCIMANCLRETGKFRQSNKANLSGVVSGEDGKQDNTQYKMSKRELQVIQQVVLISVIWVVCSLPKIVNAFYAMFEPEFAIGKRYSNLYITASRLRKTSDLVNSASTFFIHYKYNSRFRELYTRSKDV